MTEPPANQNTMARLQAAMSVYLAWRASGADAARQSVLAQHADLADLLEPLFAEHEEGEGPDKSMRSLGDYQLVREIGRGGMGVVYEAVQMSLNRRVALKVLPAHLTLRPSAIARFQREATVAAKLAHPGIVPVFGVGSDGGAHFFAMELIEGATLDRALERARDVPDRSGATVADTLRAAGVPPNALAESWQGGWVATVVRLVTQIADALHYAHASGVIHRDVKPANIFVRRDGSAVLGDFGLARDVDTQALTLTGDFAGTPNYVSPEQAQAGRVRIDHRSDVFSLGATLYECLTLQRAFSGATVADVLARIVGREPIDPQRLQPDLAPDLAAVVLKALEKEPARRYQSAAELADDLRAFLEYRPVRARRSTRGQRILRFARREPLKAMLLGTLGVGVPLVAGLSGYLLAKRGVIAAGEERLRFVQVESALAEGFVAIELKEYDAARGSFDKVLALAPEHVEAIAGLLLAGRLEGRADLVDAVLRQHAPAVARHPELARLTGGADAAATAPATALDHFLAGIQRTFTASPFVEEQWQPALADHTAAVLKSPAPRLAYLGLRALAADGAGDAAAATTTADAIELLWPDTPAAHYFVGRCLARVDPPRATRNFARIGALFPQPERVFAHVAAAQLNAGHLAEAAANARVAIGKRPDFARAHAMLGLALARGGDVEEGIAALRRAVELSPRTTAERHHLAYTLRQAGRLDEAVPIYREILDLQPRDAGAANDMGQCLQAQGQRDPALAAFARAVELSPTYVIALANLGACRAEAGDLVGAIEMLRRAAALEPTSAPVHNNLLAALDELGDAAPIRAELDRWCALFPDAPEGWHELGHHLEDHGDQDAAIAAMEKALRLVPPTPAHDALRAEIRACLAQVRGR